MRLRLLFLVAVLAFALLGRLIVVPSVSAQARTKVNSQDGLTYVWIPPGTFMMGCSPGDSECRPDENPAHQVTLTRGFWIGQTPVTQAAYKKVVGGNPSHFRGDQLPVESVSWDDAQAYCEGVGMRLPTEAEWEYAGRGGSTAARYAPLVRIAWYDGNSAGTTHQVGQKQPNGYGLYDMLGNIYEWVNDWFEYYQNSPSQDPSGPGSGAWLVLRGGDYGDDPRNVRVSCRGGGLHSYRHDFGGFRCGGEVGSP